MRLILSLCATLVAVAYDLDTLSSLDEVEALRILLQRGRYKEASHRTISLNSSLAQSDRALAAWLSSDGRDVAADAALSVFTSQARDEDLPDAFRLSSLRNAAHVESTRDGSQIEWKNFDAAHSLFMEASQLHATFHT